MLGDQGLTMMSSKDPFGLYDDNRTTVIRPQPGGIGPKIQEPRRRPVGTGGDATFLKAPIAGEGKLLGHLRGLLTLAAELQGDTAPADIADLRTKVERELARFEDAAFEDGLDVREVKTANYLVSALIDDVVLNTPWGAHSAWPGQTLCGSIHRDVAYGERVFDLLGELRQRPENNRELLQLFFLCVQLGFEGKYRRQAGSSAALADIKEDLARLLGGGRVPSAELSPMWQGVAEPHRPLAADIPFWVVAVGALALLVLVYVGFSFRLSAYGERVKTLASSLPPQEEIVLARGSGSLTAIPAPEPRFLDQLKAEIDGFLAVERERHLVETLEDSQTVTIRLLAKDEDLFRSGSTKLNDSYVGLVERVAEALHDRPSKILVVGHSDNVPIRTARFTSNWALSEARAGFVAEMLSGLLDRPDQIEHLGRADTEPIATNATPEGRARNRRIELVIVKQS